MTRPGIEPRSPGPLANTLTAGPTSRVILPRALVIGSTIYSCLFFKEINSYGPLSCPWKLLVSPSLLIAAPGTFSLPESQIVITTSTFWLWFKIPNPFLTYFQIFLTQLFFFIRVKHFSVNFTNSGYLNHQKFCDRPLFKHRTFCLVWHHLEIAVKHIFERLKYFLLWNNSKQCRIYIYGKKSEEMNLFNFFYYSLYSLHELRISFYKNKIILIFVLIIINHHVANEGMDSYR